MMITEEQQSFVLRVTEEISGTVAMLMEEANGDSDLQMCISSTLLMHAYNAQMVVYNQDKRKAIRHIQLMMEWEQSRSDI